jgi:hypothetical protein
LEELGKDDAVGPAGPDQLKPETDTRKSWQPAPGAAVSAPDIPVALGQVGGVWPLGGHEKPNEAGQDMAGQRRPIRPLKFRGRIGCWSAFSR